MLVPSGVEEALFKRAANGWIFSAPNPWTFGRRRCYLVNDAQKTDLARCVRRGRYFRLLAIVPMFGLPFAVLMLAPSLLLAPSIATWLLFAVFLAGASVAMNLCDYLPVRPLLVGLPRTTDRIGLSEMHGRQARAMSVKALATIASIEVLACLIFLAQWFTSARSDPFTLVAAAGMGCMGILFGGMLVVRLKATQSPA